MSQNIVHQQHISSYTSFPSSSQHQQQQQSPHIRQGLTDLEGARYIARRLFETYDKGRKGRIENTDCVPMISEAYKTFNSFFTPSAEDIRGYQRVLDRNQDGQITFSDIEELCVRYLTGNGNGNGNGSGQNSSNMTQTIFIEELVRKKKNKKSQDMDLNLDMVPQ